MAQKTKLLLRVVLSGSCFAETGPASLRYAVTSCKRWTEVAPLLGGNGIQPGALFFGVEIAVWVTECVAWHTVLLSLHHLCFRRQKYPISSMRATGTAARYMQ